MVHVETQKSGILELILQNVYGMSHHEDCLSNVHPLNSLSSDLFLNKGNTFIVSKFKRTETYGKTFLFFFSNRNNFIYSAN